MHNKDLFLIVNKFYNLQRKHKFVIAIIAVLVIIAFIVDFFIGSANIGNAQLFSALFKSEDVKKSTIMIVWNLRLPIAIMAVVTGMALGLSGAIMQTVLDNPLASPFTLGISSSAAFGAACAIILQVGFTSLGAWFVPVNALLFALLSIVLLEVLAHFINNSTTTVVLCGVMLVFAFNALTSVLQLVASNDSLQGLVVWTMGNLARSSWTMVVILTIAVFCMFIFSMYLSNSLSSLKLGAQRAASFGIDIKRLRITSLCIVGLLAALSVSFTGPIGFVGLCSPHIARLLVGENHKYFLSCSTLIGALILSISSAASKIIITGAVIPIGVVTSIIGIPFFLVIMIKQKHLISN